MARSKRGIGKFLARWLLRLIIAFFALLLIYRIIPPISTLMLARYVTFQHVDRDWVPLEKISPKLIRSVIVSEDAKFCTHHGVDWDSLGEVLQQTMDEDGPERGASTITMQLARNLFLWQGRSYIRKALEIPIALTIELLWPKRRILEVYLNIAEWGDGTYGIEAASQQNFHHSAQQITPYEAALLTVALPSPLRRHAGRPGPGTRELAGDLAARLNAEGADLHCLK